MPTFSQQLVDVKGRCSVTDGTYDTLIKMWLNAGQREIMNRFTWDFARDYQDVLTVASTLEYTLAQACIVYNVRNVTSVIPMTYINDLDFDRLFASQTASGSPRFFRMGGSTQTSSSTASLPKIQFYPIPDTVYTVRVRYYKELANLVNDGDISFIPEAYHDLMVFYAANILFSSLGDSRAAEQFSKFENGLLTMSDRLLAQPASHVNVLRSTDEQTTSDIVKLPASYGSF